MRTRGVQQVSRTNLRVNGNLFLSLSPHPIIFVRCYRSGYGVDGTKSQPFFRVNSSHRIFMIEIYIEGERGRKGEREKQTSFTTVTGRWSSVSLIITRLLFDQKLSGIVVLNECRS